MNLLIRACMTAAFVVGLAFAASVVVDDTAEGQRRSANGSRECLRSVATEEGYRCLEWGRVISERETRCRRSGGAWDINLGRCHFNTDVTRDNSRGSCTGYGHDQGGYGSHCDAAGGRSSGLMAPDGFGDEGPSFWEWLLWSRH